MWICRVIQEFDLLPPGKLAVGNGNGEYGPIAFPAASNGNGVGGDWMIGPDLLGQMSDDLDESLQFHLNNPLIGFDSDSAPDDLPRSGDQLESVNRANSFQDDSKSPCKSTLLILWVSCKMMVK